MKYAWIADNSNHFKVTTMCRLLGVNKGCFYRWLNKPESQKTEENKVITKYINSIFEDQRGRCGTRTIKKELSRKGFYVSRRRIAYLMKREGLVCKTKKKFRVTTDSKHNYPVSENLLNRQFDVSSANQYWVGDITYVWTDEGWVYLAVVIDLFSRMVVGWSLDSRMKSTLVNDALLMAIWKRKPAPGLVWHTDRGSQYASTSHRKIIKDHRLVQSMSRKGNCWDNAVSESFFHSLKIELVHQQRYKSRSDAMASIFEYIEVFYNRKRLHSTNDYMSPVDYEEARKVA